MSKSKDQRDIMRELDFPRWYYFMIWGVPLSLAFFSGLYVWLLLTGIIAVPVALGPLAWAPVLFAQLDKFSALMVLVISSSMLTSTVGLFSSLFTRGLLHPYTESKAETAKVLARTLETDREHNAAQITEACSHMQEHVDELCKQYHTLFTAIKLKGSSRQKEDPRRSPSPKKGKASAKAVNDGVLGLSLSDNSLLASSSEGGSPRQKRSTRNVKR